MENTTRLSVYMPITGRTSEESLISLTMILNCCVKTGRVELLLDATKKVVLFKVSVVNVTVGKSPSTIQGTTRCTCVKSEAVVVALSVECGILIKTTRDSLVTKYLIWIQGFLYHHLNLKLKNRKLTSKS
jgi:hypothetical protein